MVYILKDARRHGMSTAGMLLAHSGGLVANDPLLSEKIKVPADHLLEWVFLIGIQIFNSSDCRSKIWLIQNSLSS